MHKLHNMIQVDLVQACFKKKLISQALGTRFAQILGLHITESEYKTDDVLA